MDQEKFEKLVEEGIKAVPERFLKKLENVAIVVEDEPTHYQLEKIRTRKNLLVLGLYEGVPKDQRGNYGQVLPDKITIFKRSIEALARNEQEARRMIADTVWHEIAHHFGMDEERVRKAEAKRKERKPRQPFAGFRPGA